MYATVSLARWSSNRSSKSVRRGGGVVSAAVPAGGSRPQLERARAGVGRTSGLPRGAGPRLVRADGRAGRRRAAAAGPRATRACHSPTQQAAGALPALQVTTLSSTLVFDIQLLAHRNFNQNVPAKLQFSYILYQVLCETRNRY
jgi:hypothetical protein